MVLKFSAVAAKPHLQVNQVWSAIAVYFRQQRERSRDRRILLNLNDHDLRDLGLTRPQYDKPRRIF
jgi:uncharacterized protein YjiS (DUF1127 family)